MRYSVRTEIPDRCLENELNAFVEQGYEVVNVFQTMTALDGLVANTYCIVARKTSESVPGCMGRPAEVAANEKVSFRWDGVDTHQCYDGGVKGIYTIPIAGRYQWTDRFGQHHDQWFEAGVELFKPEKVEKI